MGSERTLVEGNWVLPALPGHDHELLQSILEFEVTRGTPPGLAWLCFVLPGTDCPVPGCAEVMKLPFIGAYVYRQGEPWFCRTMVDLQVDHALVFLEEYEYPIDDLPWGVTGGTEHVARLKLKAYLEHGGGERVSDLDSRLVEARSKMERKLQVA